MSNNVKGFTLIEIMTALAVLAIAFVILLGLRNRDIALSETASHLINATLLARQKIAELSLLKDQDTGEREGDFGESYPHYRWEMEIKETPYPQIQELMVEVLWKNQGVEEKVQFTKFLFVKK